MQQLEPLVKNFNLLVNEQTAYAADQNFLHLFSAAKTGCESLLTLTVEMRRDLLAGLSKAHALISANLTPLKTMLTDESAYQNEFLPALKRLLQATALDKEPSARPHAAANSIRSHRRLDRPGNLSTPARPADPALNGRQSRARARFAGPAAVKSIIAQQIAGEEQRLHERGGRGAGQAVMGQPHAGGREHVQTQLFVLFAKGSDGSEDRANAGQHAQRPVIGQRRDRNRGGNEHGHHRLCGGVITGNEPHRRQQRQPHCRAVAEQSELSGDQQAGNNQTEDYPSPFFELEREQVKIGRAHV